MKTKHSESTKSFIGSMVPFNILMANQITSFIQFLLQSSSGGEKKTRFVED